MAESLENRAGRVVAEVFAVPLEEVQAGTTRVDIQNWDSVNILNLILALESEFQVTLEVDELAELTSVEAILNILRRRCVS